MPGDILQNDFRMRAAFSHSLSRAVGQYASLDELDGSGAVLAVVVVVELSRFPDKLVLLPTHPNTLSNDTSDGFCFGAPVVVVSPVLVVAALELLSHDGSSAETRCMVVWVSV